MAGLINISVPLLGSGGTNLTGTTTGVTVGVGVQVGGASTGVDLGLTGSNSAGTSGAAGSSGSVAQTSTTAAATLGLGLDLGNLNLLGGSTSSGSTSGGVDVGVGLGSGATGTTGSGSTGTGVSVGVGVGGAGSGGTSTGGTSTGGTSTGGVSVGAGSGGVSVGVGAGGAGTGGTGTGGTGTGGTGTGGTGTGGTGTGGSATGGVPDPHTAFVNIFRLDDASQIPTNVNTQLNTLDQQIAAGTITASQAVLRVADAAAGFTSVAETSYQFFTGLTPTAAGLTYLVHSTANGADLSDSYYSSFNLENRYINFASNLGLHSDAAPNFAAVFGPMSFQQAVATAYERIVGTAQATAAGINWQAAEADIVSRQPYFAQVAQERFGGENQDLATKLAAVAYILEEAVKADVGLYGHANQNFLFDLADGKAQFHVDLVGVYGQGAPTNLTT